MYISKSFIYTCAYLCLLPVANHLKSNGNPNMVWERELGEKSAKTYASVVLAAQATGMSESTMTKLLRGEYVQNKKYSGRYLLAEPRAKARKNLFIIIIY